MESCWSFKWITTWDEIWDRKFIERWISWLDQSKNSNIFYHPSIVRVWFDVYKNLRNIKPRFLVSEDERGIIVFFPLVLDCGSWKDGWVRSLHPVGFGEFDYLDPIVVDNKDYFSFEDFYRELENELMNFHKKEWNVLRLPRLRFITERDAVPVKHQEQTAIIDISKYHSFEQFLSDCSRNVRHDLSRQSRRISKLGNVVLRCYTENELNEASARLQSMIDFRHQKWPNHYNPPGFFNNLVNQCIREGILLFSTLEINGKPGSFLLGFLSKDTVYCYISVYDPEYAIYSPTKIHISYLIKKYIEEKFSYFDLLRGEEEYKDQWNVTYVVLRSIESVNTDILSIIKVFIGKNSRRFLNRIWRYKHPQDLILSILKK